MKIVMGKKGKSIILIGVGLVFLLFSCLVLFENANSVATASREKRLKRVWRAFELGGFEIIRSSHFKSSSRMVSSEVFEIEDFIKIAKSYDVKTIYFGATWDIVFGEYKDFHFIVERGDNLIMYVYSFDTPNWDWE